MAEPEQKLKKLNKDFKPFTVDDHNKMIKTLDEVITDLKSFNIDNNLELDNAIKSLLDGTGRINNYYKSINNPVHNLKPADNEQKT